jgi:hypothetical protein
MPTMNNLHLMNQEAKRNAARHTLAVAVFNPNRATMWDAVKLAARAVNGWQVAALAWVACAVMASTL